MKRLAFLRAAVLLTFLVLGSSAMLDVTASATTRSDSPASDLTNELGPNEFMKVGNSGEVTSLSRSNGFRAAGAGYFPKGAAQFKFGKTIFGKFSARLTIDQNGRHSRTQNLWAYINGWSFAMAKIMGYPSTSPECPFVTVVGWFDMIGGSKKIRSCQAKFDIEITNPIQMRSVRGGPFRWRVALENSASGLVREVELLPEMKIWSSGLTMSRLRVDFDAKAVRISPGEESEIPFSVRNIGDRPSRQTEVSFPLGNRAAAARRIDFPFTTIPPGESRMGTVEVSPDNEDSFDVIVVAKNSATFREGRVIVVADGPKPASNVVQYASLGATAIGAMMLGMAGIRRIRREVA